MHRLDPIDRGDINPEEPHQAVLQFYLREVEGILIDSAGYDEGTQRYHAVAELNDGQTKLDLGYGKIEPDEKHNFATFDQAAYTVSFFTRKLASKFSRKCLCVFRLS